jgi:hypothetical protein
MLVNSITKAVLKPFGYGVPAAQSAGGLVWPVALTVSTTATPGAYLVEASCFQRDAPPVGVYEPLKVTVK